ncbi:unnamed protein product [Anisakis simplex]|uniref:Phospholipid-transporting ATPase n=1 Tax=Anisakis simplex TaxID=6269 RepID=A0A158PNP5_ANISI|nr:unnamed protein product [Anisakis simplex]
MEIGNQTQIYSAERINITLLKACSQIPDVSPTGRYTTAVPFCLILAVSALKELFEDWKRRLSDQQVNNFQTFVLKGGEWNKIKWKEVNVGDILRVQSDELFPADMVLLSSSEPNGMAYIETSNLDGETNLKIKQALRGTSHLIDPHKLSEFEFDIECEVPNRRVNEFAGTINFDNSPHLLGISQILLRGTRLKNTQWIFGAVIYTGHDAKILMNSKAAPLKRSSIDVLTNQYMAYLFVILLALAVFSACGAYYYEHQLYGVAYYLGATGSKESNFLWNVVTFFILYNNLIPISLQVTLEMVRFFQASFINFDLEMYDEASDTRAIARTSNLNEELGQVKYLVTDKTGTLTRNIMKFKRCSIAGMNFGTDEGDEFNDAGIQECLDSNSEQCKWIVEFLRVMSVCHTVVPEKGDTNDLSSTKYQASSPDEGALVRAALALNFVFHTRYPDRVIVKEDTMIFNRLGKGCRFKEETEKHLREYATKGYRTLCFAMKVIDEDEYRKWNDEFEAALKSIDNLQKKLDDCAEKIERDLILIGASAIEDKLQEGVPETIKSLKAAGIHVWMLTGDKRETAVNIAIAAALCTSETPTKSISRENMATIIATSPKDDENMVLLIDGSVVSDVFSGERPDELCELLCLYEAVICYRLTPIQKAEIVEFIKRHENHVLAIGDGANDVAMIQAANVGVGLLGEEGLQAASASDYAIAQFRFLQRLLLVHGTWNLDRSVKVILYCFYKNICLYLIELWFAFNSAFSGQTLFERWTIALFNVAFTAFPPITFGLFDRAISAKTMLSDPSLYEKFQSTVFPMRKFVLWIGMAVWHSLLLYLLSYGFLQNEIFETASGSDAWLLLGNSCYSFVVATVCLKALLECYSWTPIVIASSIGSIILWFIFLPIYSAMWPYIPLGEEMCGMAYMMMSSPSFWLAFVLIPFTALLTDLAIKIVLRSIFPSARLLARIGKASNVEATIASVGREAEQRIRDECHQLNGGTSHETVMYGSISELNELAGYAFSQEEGGEVSQGDMVRAYDSTRRKPTAVPQKICGSAYKKKKNDQNSQPKNTGAVQYISVYVLELQFT